MFIASAPGLELSSFHCIKYDDKFQNKAPENITQAHLNYDTIYVLKPSVG